MDNEEKKVKTTVPKKTTQKKVTTKRATSKAEDKPKTVKKTDSKTVKNTATKTVKVAEKKTPVKKVVGSKPVEKKTKISEVEKEQKVVTKEKKPSKELLAIRKKRYLIEAIIVAVLVIVALILVFNKTFLGLKYEGKNMEVSVPRFSYFVSDKDNKVKFVTLRKSQYLKDYYNEYLEGFVFYSCAEGENTFYYSDKTKTVIKEIEVEKKFAIKTIEVEYDTRTPEEVCGLK